MKKLLFGFAASIIAVSMTACGGGGTENLSLEDDFEKVEVNGLYELSVPDYMEEATDLNDEASLQYQNALKETYVIVIDEPKGDFEDIFRALGEWDDNMSLVENYRAVQVSYFSEGTKIYDQSKPKSLEIDGLDAEIVTIEGRPDGMIYDIYYMLGFIEGKDNIFMVTAWTLLERKQKYEKTFEMIVKSFKLL